MSNIALALIGIVIMLVLLFLGMHIGFAMMLVGFFGYWMATGNFSATLGILRQVPATTASNYSLCVIPLFILMGNLAFAGGLSDGLFNAGDKWLGRLPGGVGCATIAACAGFGAICGSAPATAATMGVVAVPKMKELGYKDTLSTGTVAAGGTLGILIPPSTPMIVYGVMAEASIGKLFAGGVVPGILLALLFMATIFIIVKTNPDEAPKSETPASMREKLLALRELLWVVVLFGVVLGGMFSGFFSVNESAAIGCVVALLIMIVRGRFTAKSFLSVLADSMKSACMVYFVIMGADVFSKFLTITNLTSALAGFVTGLDISRYVIILIIIFIYAIMGMFMDALPMITLTAPIFLPVVTGLGFDPVWFGVVCIVVMELGFITPPVGMCCYVISGVCRDVPLKNVFRGAVMFVPAILLCAVLLTVFPDLVLWLPNLTHG